MDAGAVTHSATTRVERRQVDPNDADPNNPIPLPLAQERAAAYAAGAQRLAPPESPGAAYSVDEDGDGAPNALYVWTAANVADATRPESWFGYDQRQNAPADPYPFRVPLVPYGVQVGPDADQDGVPATVTLQRHDVILDSVDGRSHTENESPVVRQADPNDADPNNPVPV